MYLFTPNTLIKSNEINANFAESILSTSHKNSYMFFVWRSAAWNMGNNAAAHLAFDSINYDIGGCYDTGLGRFTAPVSGYYWLFAQMTANTISGAGMYAAIYKNGTEYVLGDYKVPVGYTGGFGTSVSVAVTSYFNAGQYASIYSYGANNTGHTGGKATRFEGRFISK